MPATLKKNVLGTYIGNTPADLVGFYGVEPTAQPASASQTAVVQTSAAIATTGATSTSPFGFTTSDQANALVAVVNALVADIATTQTLVNELRRTMALQGLIKGSA